MDQGERWSAWLAQSGASPTAPLKATSFMRWLSINGRRKGRSSAQRAIHEFAVAFCLTPKTERPSLPRDLSILGYAKYVERVIEWAARRGLNARPALDAWAKDETGEER